ncbi:MAG: dynamin family protein [Clostridiales bacterium]|nr:dynamin family protein [Clostridiales bacterium]
MTKVEITYNPYVVKTDIIINGRKPDDSFSPLMYVMNKRLQEWIEPKGSWEGIFSTLRNSTGDSDLELVFTGTFGDFEDLAYAKDKFGNCFETIKLVHKNKDTAGDIDPYKRMIELKELYKKLQDGPIDEFKTADIKKNFDSAINSDFRIVVVAPMSSGKSTLINAIVGRDLLPAVNQATTAVITEIRDNDQFEDFLVNAKDKYGNTVAQNVKATKKVISDLNYKKDPNDPENKEALIHLIQVEGDIKNLPSNVLNTVFVDTPGGNNSQNTEHEEMMDEAIEDENKCLILYVFNGAQLGTTDSNIILKKIANAMQNSTNGKQSRDRFLFVANRMDEFDVSEEPYEEVIENTILPQLASNGITEPNLFLASAQTAKLIRMVQAGEELSETEEEDLEKLVKRFKRPTRVLSKYASLNMADKEKLITDADKYAKKAKESESIKDAEKYGYLTAELNSGIPAIEIAIKEYLEKYAIAIKIKTVHDTFMKKVIERKMIDNCEAEWAESQESFENVKRELQEKREKCNHNEKLREFKSKVEAIKLDVSPIKAQQAKVIRKMDKLVENAKPRIEKRDAEYILTLFKHNLEDIGEDAEVTLENAFNNGVRRSCEGIVSEYEEYIRELNAEGIFNIGSFNMKQTEGFEVFDISKVDDLLNEDKYTSTEKVKVGSHRVKKSGIVSGIGRFFFGWAGVGYEDVPDYEEREYINLKALIEDQVQDVKHSFDKEMNKAVKDTEEKVERLKEITMTKLKGLDKLIEDLMNEIDKMLISQDALREKVKANAEKAQWIKEFVSQVDDLLSV